MFLGGLQKTTLIDFPGRVACTVFTVGCNFRCPFCHNKDLVSLAHFKKAKLEPISEDYLFKFLKKRKKILDGVCISGGEPTIQKDLPEFCKKIKDLGLEVKVDTNGSNPKMLKKLIKNGAVDFMAMDIKSSFDEYQNLTELKTKNEKRKTTTQNSKLERNLIRNIKESIKIIFQSRLEHEFRTTVVPGLHDKEAMVELARDLKKAIQPFNHLDIQPFNYILQQFRPQNCLDPKYLEIEPFSSLQVQSILKLVQAILSNTKSR